jgi:hypothetical protein
MLSTLLTVIFLQTSANSPVAIAPKVALNFNSVKSRPMRNASANAMMPVVIQRISTLAERVQLISFCVLAISLKSTKYASRRYINGSQLLPVTWATARRVLLLSTGSVLSKRQPQRCELVELVHFCRCAISFHLPNSGLNV